MKDKEMKILLQAQQGELDAVLMYQELAKIIKSDDISKELLSIAKDEARHASVFRKLTDVELKPKASKAKVIKILVKLLGIKRTFKIIAKGEYKAADKYEKVVDVFPEILDVKKDEEVHGDKMMEISKIV